MEFAKYNLHCNNYDWSLAHLMNFRFVGFLIPVRD